MSPMLIDSPTLVVAMEVVLMLVFVVLQLLLPAEMEALMLILKVVLMMVKRVVPLMMSDDFIAVSTLFFSFLVLRCKGGEGSRVLFLVGFRMSHKSHILCLFVLIDLCTRLLDLVLCWTSLWYFVVMCGQALIYAW
jgi:hypothetical protein